MIYQYDDLLREIMDSGEQKPDRTGTGCKSIFGPQLWFNLTDGFPAVVVKKLHWQSVVKELLWFIRGETNTKTLGCGIWDAWADSEGELGPIYGKQWRKWEAWDGSTCFDQWDQPNWEEVDQLAEVIKSIRESPRSRRHIVSAWNVADLRSMSLPPCHLLFQFNVGYLRAGTGCPLVPTFLDCKMTQRSADSFLGLPFNIAQYSLLTHMVARITGLVARNVVVSLGDAHVYDNHTDAVAQYLGRACEVDYPQPTLSMPEFKSLEELEQCDASDFVLNDYQHGPPISAPIAV